MTDTQVLTIAITLSVSFVAVLLGVLLNNSRLGDMRELIAAKVETRAAAKDVSDLKVALSDMRVLIEKNHSETLLRMADIDNRLGRIEHEKRVIG